MNTKKCYPNFAVNLINDNTTLGKLHPLIALTLISQNNRGLTNREIIRRNNNLIEELVDKPRRNANTNQVMENLITRIKKGAKALINIKKN